MTGKYNVTLKYLIYQFLPDLEASRTSSVVLNNHKVSYIHFLSEIHFMIKWTQGFFIFVWRQYLDPFQPTKNNKKTQTLFSRDVRLFEMLIFIIRIIWILSNI